jgi:NAD(P)-dependent dehydrogenase (short-subunit alcohol dehydrogenase family)
VRALGRRALVLQADVANYDAVQAMVASAVSELGKLDIVGRELQAWRRDLRRSPRSTPPSGAVSSRPTSTARSIPPRAAIEHVIAQRGAVLFISSIGADAAAAGGAAYHVAKAGVNTLTKVLAKEVARRRRARQLHRARPDPLRHGRAPLRFVGNSCSRASRWGGRGAVDVGRAAVFLASADAGLDHRQGAAGRRRRVDVSPSYLLRTVGELPPGPAGLSIRLNA